MDTQTLTGTLIFGDGQVALDDGTVLAIPGPNPCATAAGRFAKYGQTQPVTVTGYAGTVDNLPVFYVTSIQWAAQAPATATTADFSVGSGPSLDQAPASLPAQDATAEPAPKKKTKKAAAKSARSRPSK